MGLVELKQKSDEIREARGSQRSHWPNDFKADALSYLENGGKVQSLERATGIPHQTLNLWLKKAKMKSKSFKEIEVIEKQPWRSITLRWKNNLEVSGLSFQDFKELLTEGLL